MNISLVVKGVVTFFDFQCFYLLFQRMKSAEGSDSRLGSFQHANVVLAMKMFLDLTARNTFRCKYRFAIVENAVHFSSKISKFLKRQDRAFVLHLA